MGRMRFSMLLTAVMMAAAAWISHAGLLQAAEPEQVTSVEGITEYRLENGVKVLLFPDPSKPTVTVNMTVFVGSRHEGYGEGGMAHLLEHMLFKGTPSHENIPKELQSRGAQFNGTTWLDRTNYYETLPASPENLEFALRLEADRLVNSYVKAEDLASEMTVVRNEFERGENSPSRVLAQKMMAAAYEWHNYGKSTIGNRADIERVPIDKLQAFYRKYYQPDNIMVVIAGAFEEEQALGYVRQYFGSIPRPDRELPQTYTSEPAQDGERRVTLRRVGDVAVVGAVYHIPSGPHPDYVAIDVMESILTAAPSGRLYKALVETQRAADISGAAFALHDPGVLRFMAEVTEGNAPEIVLETMIDVIEGLAETEITQEEVDRARDRLMRFREQTALDSQRIAIELSEWAAQGDWRLYFLYRDRLEAVTPEDVTRVADTYLRQNNRTVGIYIPTKESDQTPIPETPELAGMIGDYKGREAIQVGEAFDVSPQNIESRTERVTLDSGLKAALLPKKTRGATVKVRLTLRYGNLDTLQGKATAADFLPVMMLRGTESLDRQQLQDELNKHRIQLSASGSAGEATFRIETTREKLTIALGLLSKVLREPTFPESELATLKQAQLAQYQQALTDPTSQATTYVNKKVNPYEPSDPRYVASPKENLELIGKLSIDDVRKLYEELLNGQDGELAVVGDFETAELVGLMNETLADWSRQVPYERIPRTGDIEVKAEVVDIQIPGKANATYFAGSVFPLRDDHPDYPALVMGNFILGGGSLSSRLGDRVRQKEGLSYGVGSGLRASSLDPRSAFYIFAIANPDNVPKLKSVIVEELNLLREKGITEQELETAKQGYLQRREVARTDDSQLAGILAETIVNGRTMEFTAEHEAKIREVTTSEALEAVRKYIDPEELVIAVAGDLK